MKGWKHVPAKKLQLFLSFSGGAHGSDDEFAGAGVDVVLD